jgi:polar amino acid transport system substrate-binding protein
VCLILLLTPGRCPAKQPYLVLTEELAPVHYTDNGTIKGIATEVVQAIFDKAGLQAEFKSFPWKRAYRMALNTKDCFIYTINRTPQREPHFQWIGPILPKKTSLFKLKSRKDIHLNRLEDVGRYTTAVLLGHSLTTRLLDMGFEDGKELIVTTDKKTQLQLFLQGRVDLITGNEYTIAAITEKAGRSLDDIEPALLVTQKGYYLATNMQSDPDLVDRLQQANTEIQQSSLIQEIVAKYMR